MDNFKGCGPYGFRPSEEELIGYLESRIFLGPDYLVQDITDLGADICNWDPWDLLGGFMVGSSDPVRYFIYPKTYKHPKSKSKMINMVTDEGPGRKRKSEAINRAAPSGGKWKVSGGRVKIKTSDSKEIGIKTRLYFFPNLADKESKKKSKTKGQKSYQNMSSWMLYQYELIDVEPSKNKYFLGKLMLKSEPTHNSSYKGETSKELSSNYLENEHIPIPEAQLHFHPEPLVEMEVSHGYDWIQNQSSEQTTEFVNSFPAVNHETYPGEGRNQENFVNDGNEVLSHEDLLNLEKFFADYVDFTQNLQVDISEPVTQHDQSFRNVLGGNDEIFHEERSNKHNVVAENEGFSLPNHFSSDHTADISQMNSFGFDDSCLEGVYLHELFGEMEASDNNGDGVQNQSSINQQAADECRNANLIDNETAYSDEVSKSAAAEIEGSNFPSLGMESSRKRSSMELEGSSIDIEAEVAQAQAKKSRF